MQTSIATEPSQSSSSLLINRATLWDNSSKEDDNNLEKCVAPLTDNAWKSVSTLKDAIDGKYGLISTNVRIVFRLSIIFKVKCVYFCPLQKTNNNNDDELIPWTNSDLQQVRSEKAFSKNLSKILVRQLG